MCEVCALFCHAGHDLEPGNRGNPSRTICDCGAGWFDDCKDINSKNPLNDFGLVSKLTCSLKNCTLGEENLFSRSSIFSPRKRTGDQSSKRPTIPGIKSEFNLTKLDEAKEEEFLKGLFEEGNEEFGSLDSGEQLKHILSLYTNAHFKRDILSSLNSSKFNQNENISNLMIPDQELKKEIHLLEHFIYLGFGSPRISMLPLFSVEKPITEAQIKGLMEGADESVNNEFEALAAVVSLAKCDTFNFEQYGSGLCEALNIDSRKEYTAIDKVRNLLLIVDGAEMRDTNMLQNIDLQMSTQSDQDAQYSEKLSDAYDLLFAKLFGKSARKAQIIHALLTINKTDLVAMINKDIPSSPLPQLIILKVLNIFLIISLGFTLSGTFEKVFRI